MRFVGDPSPTTASQAPVFHGADCTKVPTVVLKAAAALTYTAVLDAS